MQVPFSIGCIDWVVSLDFLWARCWLLFSKVNWLFYWFFINCIGGTRWYGIVWMLIFLAIFSFLYLWTTRHRRRSGRIQYKTWQLCSQPLWQTVDVLCRCRDLFYMSFGFLRDTSIFQDRSIHSRRWKLSILSMHSASILRLTGFI